MCRDGYLLQGKRWLIRHLSYQNRWWRDVLSPIFFQIWDSFLSPILRIFFPWTSEETWWKWWLICWTLTVIAHFFGTIKRNPEEREREKESHLPLCRVSMSVSRVRVCAAACVSPWIRDKAPPSSFLLDFFSYIFIFTCSKPKTVVVFFFNQRRKKLSDSLLRVVAPSSTTTLDQVHLHFVSSCVCVFPFGVCHWWK